jgi:hypothetical protein
MVNGLEIHCGETIVPHGAVAANALGLTTQVPVRAVYLTSGRSRKLKLGAQIVELRHAPVWQLILPGRTAGDVVRALAWLGPEKVGVALRKLRTKLSSSELKEVAAARARLPTWMAKELGALKTGKENSVKSVVQEEDAASETLFPDLKDHLNYANDAYNLVFKVQESIGGKRLADISDVAKAQFMILMRITDFLRCIQLLAIKGYPEQAGTLAASIFELAHTAAFFSHSPQTAEVWLQADSINQQAPKHIPGQNWKDTVKANYKHANRADQAEAEYRIYQQLCWMKHSLPKMQDMRVETDGVSLIVGPHTDGRALSHAWFSLEHAGRLAEFVVSLLMNEFGTRETNAMLQTVGEQRGALAKRAIERFGQENPFRNEPGRPRR